MEHSRIRALVTAFGTVPGPNPHSAALLGMAASVRGELDLVTLRAGDLSHQARVSGSRLFRVKVSGSPAARRAAFARAVRRQLEAEAYDIVHVRGPFEGEAVASHHGNLGFRFIYEVATFPDEAEGPELEAGWAGAHTRCLESADLILVATEAAARSLSERGYGGKVAVVPPGVDVDAYDWWPAAETPVARLLYLGNYAADRELGILLAAVRIVASKHAIRVMLAGEPDSGRRQRIRELVHAFDLSNLVEVRGEPRSVAIPTLIGAAHVGIVTASMTPRFQEHGDIPEPLLEHLACRRPVVAAGVPGVAEVIRDEREGLLYLPGDEGTLAEGVLSMLRDPSLRERVTASAYERVRRNFSGAARRRRIAEVYEMLAPGSQSYDAWDEAFDHQSTGVHEMPPDFFELADADTTEFAPPKLPDTSPELMLPSRMDTQPMGPFELETEPGRDTTETSPDETLSD